MREKNAQDIRNKINIILFDILWKKEKIYVHEKKRIFLNVFRIHEKNNRYVVVSPWADSSYTIDWMRWGLFST